MAAVWSVVRRFDQPQTYKQFVRSCMLLVGDGGVGKVRIMYGLPTASSHERLDILDDDSTRATSSASRSSVASTGSRTISPSPPSTRLLLRPTPPPPSWKDVAPGNTAEDTRVLVDTIIKCY
ncbi:unnamed protein product [Miscanthus lutarioriparius]|uniref:Uncharacterized protein n=1 Tax=Miscanthus lutarioriparius TaxID=422564 RepID=A0A811RBY9_9POAL|nr:unnamed protein product [Miscanthus lutarioriparius]